MEENHSVFKDYAAGFFCAALLPMLAVAFGILSLANHVVLNLSFTITFFLIPLIAVGLLAWCVFSGIKNGKKMALSIVILLLFLVSFFFSWICASITQVKHYEGTEAEQKCVAEMRLLQMPELSDIGQPTEVEYYYVDSSFAIFCSETNHLICRYTPEEYEIQKARLDEEYIFQTETITLYDSSCEPMTEIDGYRFRMLSTEAYKESLYYPKSVILIGYSDEAREIVYIAYYNFDLDYISSLDTFIVEDCGWKYVR